MENKCGKYIVRGPYFLSDHGFTDMPNLIVGRHVSIAASVKTTTGEEVNYSSELSVFGVGQTIV